MKFSKRDASRLMIGLMSLKLFRLAQPDLLDSRSQAPAWERKSSKLRFVSIPTDLKLEIQQKVPTEHALALWGSLVKGVEFCLCQNHSLRTLRAVPHPGEDVHRNGVRIRGLSEHGKGI
jgi:hypothetical protein